MGKNNNKKNNNKKNNNKKNNNKKNNKKKTFMGILMSIVAIFGVFLTYYPSDFIKDGISFFNNNINDKISVYNIQLAEVQELTHSYIDIVDRSNSNEFIYAVKDKLFVQNNTDTKISIDQIDINILDSSPFYKSDIEVIQGMYQDHLILYAINNGNKDSETQKFQVEVSMTKIVDGKTTNDLLSVEETENLLEDNTIRELTLSGGEIHRIFDFHTENKLKELFQNNRNLNSVNFKLKDTASNKEFNIYSINYEPISGKFVYSGFGAVSPFAYYKILEVYPSMPKKISVSDFSDIIDEKSNQNFNIILLAQKSSTIKYNHTIKLKGKSIESKEIKTANIFVPLYNLPNNYPNQEIFNRLCQNNIIEYQYDNNVIVKDSIKYDYRNAYKLISNIE